MDLSEIRRMTQAFPITRDKEVPRGSIREIEVCSQHGHIGATWNADNAAEVENARAIYDRLIGKGFRAFSVKRDGTQDQPMKAFDPQAEKMLFTSAIAGG